MLTILGVIAAGLYPVVHPPYWVHSVVIVGRQEIKATASVDKGIEARERNKLMA